MRATCTSPTRTKALSGEWAKSGNGLGHEPAPQANKAAARDWRKWPGIQQKPDGAVRRHTAQDTIVKIPVSGEPLQPGTPEVFVNRAGGGPDGIIIDEDDNLWIACNQSDEIMVIEPKQGRVIAKLGDFGGIDNDGAPIGFLWSNSLVFHGEDVLVTNLSLDVGALRPALRTVDGPWADQVKVHTGSKIKKRIPGVPR